MMAQSVDRLSLLYRISQTFNSTLDLDQVLQRVIDEVIAATRAERGFLMLYNAAGELEFKIARGMDRHTIGSPEFQVSRGVVERVARDGEPQLTSDAQKDAWLSARTSVVGLGLRSILCVPLQWKDTRIGVIYVDNRLQAGIFQPADLDLLSTIAASATTAIENARLYQVAVEKGRLERELQVARQVQASLIPSETPRLEGWEFAALWQPARVVSGDFYDFIPISTHATSARLGLVIGDVSDKAMGAALFMALTRAIVRGAAVATHSPAQSITQANRLICADAANGMFVTLWYGLIEEGTGDLTYVNAGHNLPWLYQAQTDQFSRLERTGMALGVFEESTFTERTVHLDSGDWVFLYTDGITDAENGEGKEFGEENLAQLVHAQRHASPQTVVAAIERSLREFVGHREPFDDITAVVIKRV